MRELRCGVRVAVGSCLVTVAVLWPLAGVNSAAEPIRVFDDPELTLISTDCLPMAAESCGCFDPQSPNALGDVLGLRKGLAEHGIGWAGSVTQFYQGVAHGGIQEVFRYGGKADQFINIDGEKAGLWKGFFVSMHAETRFGDDVNFDAVSLAPVNANMLYPKPGEDVTAITGLTFTQALSEEWLVSAGKFNLFDLFAQLYPQTGRGIDGFMNVSSFVPLATGLGLNLSVMGVGVTKLHEGQVEGSLSVLDTHNSATTSGFNDLWGDGACVIGFYRIFTEVGGLPGSHALQGVYSSAQFTSVDPLTWSFVPNVGIVAGTESDTWNLAYYLEQKLWVDAGNPKRNVGILASLAMSDGNPNPIHWSSFVSMQGQGFIDRRPLDSAGVAVFYTGLSSDFERLARPLIDVEDPYGAEIYYNFAVTPWFHLTPDLQIINPAEVNNDTAVVVGLRGKIDL